MNQEKIDRINQLARKSKAEGLNEAEKRSRRFYGRNILPMCGPTSGGS